MNRSILIAAAAVSLAGCMAPPDEVRRDIAAWGFTDVTLDGYAWMGCGRDDTTAMRFSARAQNGALVHGVACGGVGGGWGKGITVRLMGS